MTLDRELQANRSELIGDWGRLKKLSWRAESFILEIHLVFGYIAAILAIKAATAAAGDVRNCEYEKQKKEAEWRAEWRAE